MSLEKQTEHMWEVSLFGIPHIIKTVRLPPFTAGNV